MHLTQTHTVVLLEVPPELYEHVAAKLKEAGYGHAFGEGGMIDMSGIALIANPDLKLDEVKVKDPFDPTKYEGTKP